MFKAMFFLYRRGDLTTDAFQAYSKGTHMPRPRLFELQEMR